MGKRAPPSQVSCVTTLAKARAQVLWWQRQEESVGCFLVEREIALGECLAGSMLEHFPVKDGRGSPIFCGPWEGWPLGQNHRWQER